MRKDNVRLVQITTVSASLSFLSGQPAYMMARGIETRAISSPGRGLEIFRDMEKALTYSVKMPRRITPVNDLFALRNLYGKLRAIRPDIVHAHTPKGGLLGTTAAWLARVPIRIYHVHGLPLMTATGYKRYLLRWSEWLSCRLATQVLCVSQSVREVVIAEKLCPEAKIKVLLNGSINGVDADVQFNPSNVAEGTREAVRAKYDIPESAEVIGFVGRVVRDKGLIELIQAWRTLREEFPNLHLMVVGPFEPQDPIPTDIEEEMRTDSRIKLTGFQDDLPPLYSAMDLVALPTYREGFNITLMETAAMQLPAVATSVPGCVDVIVDGVTGTLVPPRDRVALQNAIRKYLDDPELRQRHAKAGRERILRDYRQKDVWEAIFIEYKRLLADAKIPLPSTDDTYTEVRKAA